MVLFLLWRCRVLAGSAPFALGATQLDSATRRQKRRVRRIGKANKKSDIRPAAENRRVPFSSLPFLTPDSALLAARAMTDADGRSRAAHLTGCVGASAELDATNGGDSLLHRFCAALGDCCPDHRQCAAVRAYSNELLEWSRRPISTATTRVNAVAASPVDSQTRQSTCVDSVEQRAPPAAVRQKTLSVAVDDDEAGASAERVDVPSDVSCFQSLLVTSSLCLVVLNPRLALVCPS